MRNIVFTPTGWADVDKLEKENKRLYQKLRSILTETARNPLERGSSKAEKLKGELSGFYSKRIDQKHRLIYTFNDGEVIVIGCYGHYDD